MTHSSQDLPNLSPAQREIMEIVWQRGEVTASEVQRALAESRRVARNTVRTLLERMEDKGWLRHRTQGRTYIYTAVWPRSTTVGQKVRDLVENVCGGSPETLVAALLDYRRLKPDELRRIRQMLDRSQAGRRPQGS